VETYSLHLPEVRVDGNDDDEAGYSEDDHGEDEDGAVSHSKRRQARSFNLTTGTVRRMESKEDGILTATRQVGGHALPGVAKNPPDFMKESNWNDTHTHTHPDIHTLTIVSRTHTFHCH